MARAVASTLECNFLKVVSSAIVDKYIGESARVIREMFEYARDHEPCVIFMDEIDAIGGRRYVILLFCSPIPVFYMSILLKKSLILHRTNTKL